MPLSVLFPVLFAALLHAFWNGLIKGGSDRLLDTAGILLGAAVTALIILPFLAPPEAASWRFLAASGIVHIAYFRLIATCYDAGDMSVVYPISRGTAPALTAVFSALILHEHPSAIGWCGVLLVSSGILTFAFENGRGKDRAHVVPMLLALLNAFVIALYTLIDGTGVRLSAHPMSYTCWGFLICAVNFSIVAALARKGRFSQHLKKHRLQGLVGGSCSLAAYTIVLWAMTRAPIAAVAALRETAILFGVLLATIKLKERVSPTRVIACLFIVAGAVAIQLS